MDSPETPRYDIISDEGVAHDAPARAEEACLEELVDGEREHRVSLPLRIMVGLLKRTHPVEDTADYSGMGGLERFVAQKVKRPLARPADCILRPALGFLVRGIVGSTSGDIQSDAASYLEKELGIKETPLEYTRTNLVMGFTYGAVYQTMLTTGLLTIPAALALPTGLASLVAIASPIIYIADNIRRLFLYSRKMPSGPIYFEAAWWARKQLQTRVLAPAKEFYAEHLAPRIEPWYAEHVAPLVDGARGFIDGVKGFYTERIVPLMDRAMGFYDEHIWPALPAFLKAGDISDGITGDTIVPVPEVVPLPVPAPSSSEKNPP